MKEEFEMPLIIILGFILSFMIIYFPHKLFKNFTPLALLGLWIIIIFVLYSMYTKETRNNKQK